MNESTDTPQSAYLRDLTDKRNAAFFKRAMTERELIAAYREATRTHPQWSRITPPIRSNSPRAGDFGYEGEIPPPPHITRRGWVVLIAATVAAAYGWWWLLSWAAGVIGGGR